MTSNNSYYPQLTANPRQCLGGHHGIFANSRGFGVKELPKWVDYPFRNWWDLWMCLTFTLLPYHLLLVPCKFRMYEWMNEWIWTYNILAITGFALGHIYFISGHWMYKQSQTTLLCWWWEEHKSHRSRLLWQSGTPCRWYLPMWLCTPMCYWVWFPQNISECECSILIALWTDNNSFHNQWERERQENLFYHKVIWGVGWNGWKACRLCFNKRVQIPLISLRLW